MNISFGVPRSLQFFRKGRVLAEFPSFTRSLRKACSEIPNSEPNPQPARFILDRILSLPIIYKRVDYPLDNHRPLTT